jgi:uncharacterized repeat protein (TIGR01451 family)
MLHFRSFVDSNRWYQAVMVFVGLILAMLAMMPTLAVAQGAPFTCDVVFYQLRSDNANNNTIFVKFAAVSSSVTPTAALPTTVAPTLNALGYNPVDNYLYAIQNPGPNLYRIGQSGVQLVGPLTNTVPSGSPLATFTPTGGVFDAAGRFYFAGQGGTGINPPAIFRVDSIPVSGNVNVVHQYNNVIGGTATIPNYGDFDFNGAGGPNALVLAATGIRFFRIQLAANATTPGIGTATHTEFGIPDVGGIGSAFYDAFASRFYVFNNSAGAAGGFYEITNPQSGTPSSFQTPAPLYVGPPSIANQNNTDGTSCPISGTRVTDLSIAKSDGNVTVTTNQVVAYNITVTNAGPYPANYSVVADPAQPGIQKLSVTCSAIGGPPSAVCPPGLTTSTFQTGVTVNTFPPGTALLFTLNALITPTVGPVTNVATVTPAIDTTDIDSTNNRATDTNAISGTAPTVISAASICPANTVESPINRVTNGNFSAALPFSTAAQVTGTLNTLQANSNAVQTFVARQSGQQIYNPFGAPNFVVSQRPFPGDLSRSVIGGNEWLIANGKFNTAPATVDMWRQPIGGLVAGRTYQAMFYVSNAAQPGQTPALLPSVRPQFTTSTSVFLTPALALTNETILTDDRWTLVQGTFTLPTGGTGTVSIADVTAGAGGENGGVWALAGVTVRECIPAADVRVSKTNNVSSLDSGGTAAYTITLRNTSTVAATTLTFSDPAVSNFIKGSVTCVASAGSQCPTPATVTTVLSVETTGVTVPVVGINSTVTFLITGTVTGAAGSTVTNIASIVPIGYIDTNPTNDSAQDSDPVRGSVNLSITKTNTVTSLVAGSTTSYSITITNTGPSTVNNALFRDTPSAGLVCTSISCVPTGAALCPLPANLTIANMTGPGIQIPSLPAPPTSAVRFTINCNVTATGVP